MSKKYKVVSIVLLDGSTTTVRVNYDDVKSIVFSPIPGSLNIYYKDNTHFLINAAQVSKIVQLPNTPYSSKIEAK